MPGLLSRFRPRQQAVSAPQVTLWPALSCPRCGAAWKRDEAQRGVCEACLGVLRSEAQATNERVFLANWLFDRREDERPDANTLRLRQHAVKAGVSWLQEQPTLTIEKRLRALLAPYTSSDVEVSVEEES